MVENYDYEKIKKLADKIDRIKSKTMLVTIFNIIKTTNPDIAPSENDNGLFIKFNGLNNETYIKIENYLRKNLSKKSSEEISEVPTEYIPYSTEELGSQS